MQERRSVNTTKINGGPYLAKIVSHLDPAYMGTLQVELLHNMGNLKNRTGSTFQVKYLSPFYGVTSYDHTTPNNDYGSTQKSYGFWAVPPDVGTTVVVIFIEGDPKRGYWIGCVQDEYMNFMVPGIAATSLNEEGKRLPVAEYNKRNYDGSSNDPTKFKKPIHPFSSVLAAQGLISDEYRGVTSSSARREVPSMVFGISTPGPVDRRKGAPKGRIGKRESLVDSTFISRLGGSSFVMDDGDDKFIRKTHASVGPPIYVSPEKGDTSGDPTIPHNELVRIRTRTGHQILLHNSEDLIYIANSRGTAWIELTSNGKIDIYAADSISLHTEKDFNVVADRDINMQAKRNINITAGVDRNLTVKGNQNTVIGVNSTTSIGGTCDISVVGACKKTYSSSLHVTVGAGGNLTVTGDFNLLSSGNNRLTAGANTDILSSGVYNNTASMINENGPAAVSASAAESAAPATVAPLPPRVPQHEPWAGHENLNPLGEQLTVQTGTPDTFRKGN